MFPAVGKSVLDYGAYHCLVINAWTDGGREREREATATATRRYTTHRIRLRLRSSSNNNTNRFLGSANDSPVPSSSLSLMVEYSAGFSGQALLSLSPSSFVSSLAAGKKSVGPSSVCPLRARSLSGFTRAFSVLLLLSHTQG